jgi:hypothetical protein
MTPPYSWPKDNRHVLGYRDPAFIAANDVVNRTVQRGLLKALSNNAAAMHLLGSLHGGFRCPKAGKYYRLAAELGHPLSLEYVYWRYMDCPFKLPGLAKLSREGDYGRRVRAIAYFKAKHGQDWPLWIEYDPNDPQWGDRGVFDEADEE